MRFLSGAQVSFISLILDTEDEESDAAKLADRLDVDVVPTLQFWRSVFVWWSEGVLASGHGGV